MAKKIANFDDYDTDAIDKKFEKLDRATIAKMTGTGSNLSRKTTTKKKTKKK